MKDTKKLKISDLPRLKLALITNHGYAGVNIPVGGAADTGGQNFYVNALAHALAELGTEVTIFARGGFPFFESERIREGEEKHSNHVTYVYIPGGGDKFIHKEDIAIALDEETEWISHYICEKALKEGVRPWEYFEAINTHYWDAAIIGYRLLERWKDQIAYEFLNKVNGGIFSKHLTFLKGDERHRQSLSREVNLHAGRLAFQAFPNDQPKTILTTLLGDISIPSDILEPSSNTNETTKAIELSTLVGETLIKNLKLNDKTLNVLFKEADKHVWTPHSAGIIKERNFWNKDKESVRKLKFRERNSHEETICKHTHLFCSTSPEIWQALVSYHGVHPSLVFDFPPCIDENTFRPRTSKELEPTYKYLSDQSGISVDKLKASKIVFETSRMDHTKRKDILLQAFAKAVGKHDDRFLFIGGGPANSDVFRQLEKLKASIPALEGRAFLLGFVPNEIMGPLFSLPDLFVSASEMEGFGMSVSQAAAAGVAVVSSDLIPFSTQYAGDSAVVVKAGDVNGFAEAITRLLDDDEDRARHAKEIKKVADTLIWRTTARRFIGWLRAKRY